MDLFVLLQLGDTIQGQRVRDVLLLSARLNEDTVVGLHFLECLELADFVFGYLARFDADLGHDGRLGFLFIDGSDQVQGLFYSELWVVHAALLHLALLGDEGELGGLLRAFPVVSGRLVVDLRVGAEKLESLNRQGVAHVFIVLHYLLAGRVVLSLFQGLKQSSSICPTLLYLCLHEASCEEHDRAEDLLKVGEVNHTLHV